VDTPRYRRTKETEEKIRRECARLSEEIQDHTEDTLAQAVLTAFRDKALDSTSKKKRKKQRHWWSSEIDSLFLRKQEHLRKNGKDEDFKKLDKELNDEIRKAKNESFREYASGLDHRNQNSDVYRAIQNIGSRQPPKIAQLTVRAKDGSTVTNMEEKANTLSRRYQVPLGYHPKRDILRKQMLKKHRKEQETKHPRGIDHTPFTAAEARIAIEEMANKAPGLSRIRKEDLEIGGDEMNILVAQLADKIAHSGQWPQILKKGVTCPIPKDDEATDIIKEDQTRPITLLETLDKWLQKLFYNRIKAYVKYEETQAGYCLGCDHHTTLVTDFVMNRTDRAYTLAVFTDISKAFDSVPLDELIHVIWSSDIPAPYKWTLASFVERREFRVEIRDDNGNVSASKWRKMIYGTPQGSVLGPLLWNLFFDPLLRELAEAKAETDMQTLAENAETETATNIATANESMKEATIKTKADRDIAANNTAAPAPTRGTQPGAACGNRETKRAQPTLVLDNLDVAYADDLTLLAASKDPKRAEILLEKKLTIFKNFLETRGMKAATHKLKIMSLDPHKRGYSPKVLYEGKLIEEVEEHKFLGITYDKHMSFEKHWELVVTSIVNRTKILSRLRAASWGPTQQTFKVLHRSYIESRVRYGILAWYPFITPTLKNKLEVHLRRSIRIVMGLPIHCWNEALMAESDLDSAAGIALKCAVSFHSRINPTDKTQMTLVKKHYLEKQPIWAQLLRRVPGNIWQGNIQVKLSKKVLIAADSTCIRDKTLHTQKQADAAEQNFKRILYTDASVIRMSTPPGKAATGFTWYEKTQDGLWREAKSGSATIGYGHSSYSAEATAIRIGLENDPQLTRQDEPDFDNQEPTCEIGIFTDSLSNLATIKKGIAETPEQEVLLRTIAQHPNKLTFHHVKAHQDNWKNIAVDNLCNANATPPGRKNANHLGGKKTASKIKQWMDDWASNQRMKDVVHNSRAQRRGSATQKWMSQCLVDGEQQMKPRPKIHNQLPRRKGVLLAKVRTNRWTQCNWYLHFIKQRPSPLCKECRENDTTEHVINKCSLHEAERSLLQQKLNYVGKISDLLSSNEKTIVETLASYLIVVEDKRKAIRKEEEKEAEEREEDQ
jgi:hypothetical protein